MAVKLYPHNELTYKKITNSWESSDKVAAIQPTGTGKSFLILKCLEDFNTQNKLVLAPTHNILNQFQDHIGTDIDNVNLMTYSGLATYTQKEIEALNVEFIVLDEIHRCGAEVWGEAVKKLLLSFPNAKVLGTTATPIRYLNNMRNMCEELLDGNIANQMTLAQAFLDGIITMPKYISALYTFDEELKKLKEKIKNSSNDNDFKEAKYKEIKIMKQNLNKSKGIPQILQKHLTDKNGKFIVFCKNKEHLQTMKSVVVGWFKKAKLGQEIHTYEVYSDYENSDQDFENFKNDKADCIRLLFSIEMLNEGVHVDDISGVMLLRSTTSPTLYYQQIGRGLDAGKKQESIIFDFVNNFDSIKSNGLKSQIEEEIAERIASGKMSEGSSIELDIFEFKIYDEMQDVKEMFLDIESQLNDDWDAMYLELLKFYNKNGHSNISVRIGKIGTWVSSQRASYKSNLLSNDRVKLLEDIDFVWDIKEYNWNMMYQQLFQFYKKYKHCNVLRCSGLGYWVATQRRCYHNKALSIDRINMLNRINFSWKIYDERWEYGFEQLQKYFLEYGHCLVNYNYIDKDNFKLSQWVCCQRRLKNKNSLQIEQINKLKYINFIWDVSEYTWNITYEECKNNIINFKNGIIPVNYISKNGFNLYNWYYTQKNLYKDGNLTEDKVNKLENIGFILCDKSDYYWNNMFIKLNDFKIKNGHCNIPYSNKSLYNWIANQRRHYKNGELPKNKIDKLQSVGFEFKKDKWNNMFNEAVIYINKNGNLPPQSKHIKLGVWLTTQKKNYKKGILSEERINKLLSVGIEFTT